MPANSLQLFTDYSETLKNIVENKFLAFTESIQELEGKEELLIKLNQIKQEINNKLLHFLNQEIKIYQSAMNKNDLAKMQEVMEDLFLVEDLLNNASPDSDVFTACYNRALKINGSPLIEGLLVVGCILAVGMLIAGVVLLVPSLAFFMPITMGIGIGLIVLSLAILVSDLSALTCYTQNAPLTDSLSQLTDYVQKNLEIQQPDIIIPGRKFCLFAAPAMTFTEGPDVGVELSQLAETQAPEEPREDPTDNLVEITL